MLTLSLEILIIVFMNTTQILSLTSLDWKVIITTNQATSSQNMNIIEECMKESKSINLEYINSLWLPKSKLYLKILDLSYLIESTNQPITSEIVIEAIQQTHIFKDVALTLKLCIIKSLLNSNSAIVWVDIWNSQNSSIAKSILNQYFTIEKYIATIHGTNTNPRVPQCKNCWKWGYSILIC